MEGGWSRAGAEAEKWKFTKSRELVHAAATWVCHLGLIQVTLPPPPEAGDRAHLPVLGTAISRGSLELSPARNPRGLELLETMPV